MGSCCGDKRRPRLCVGSCQSYPTQNVAEAMAMLKGLKFAKELLFLNIQAESIKDKHLVSVYLETIAKDCVKSSSSFNSINFKIDISRKL